MDCPKEAKAFAFFFTSESARSELAESRFSFAAGGCLVRARRAGEVGITEDEMLLPVVAQGSAARTGLRKLKDP
jgi:hypothetical protein